MQLVLKASSHRADGPWTHQTALHGFTSQIFSVLIASSFRVSERLYSRHSVAFHPLFNHPNLVLIISSSMEC